MVSTDPRMASPGGKATLRRDARPWARCADTSRPLSCTTLYVTIVYRAGQMVIVKERLTCSVSWFT
jgi:hypothetical protein